MLKYSCPECKSTLNPTQGIVLLGQHGRQRGLFVFDPKPGHYGYEIDSVLSIEPGSVWEFLCPVCHHNLTTHYSSKLAHVRLEDDGAEFVTIFSKVANERATFVLTKEHIETFGEDYSNYLELSIQKHYW